MHCFTIFTPVASKILPARCRWSYILTLILLTGLTQQGLEDLRNGIIRTPLPPKETFQDDPLRVLRCVRFASRFGFDIISDVEEAAKDSAIQVLE
jgi:hypothetical protein